MTTETKHVWFRLCFWHTADPSGFFSKQLCCYYCRALQWLYVNENEGLAEYLYTAFGPQAAHRNTFLGNITHHDTIIHSPTKHPPEVGVTRLAECGAGMLWGQRANCSNKTVGVWQQGQWANAPAGATQGEMQSTTAWVPAVVLLVFHLGFRGMGGHCHIDMS